METLSFATTDTLLRLGVALALGLLIGLERGWERRDIAEGARVAGIRTFGIIGLLGGTAATLSEGSGALVLAAAVISLGLLLAVSYWHQTARHGQMGVTTLVAALLTFVFGAMAGQGFLLPAAVASVAVALLLSVKSELHGLLARIDRRELFATLRLLLISVVLLPILPNRGFGPLEALNPYQLWLMVVLIAGVSYVGYVSVMLVGDRRGILAAALLGGLVSSTAVAINLGRLAREHPQGRELFAAGIIGASTMMFPRVLIVAAVFAPVVASALFLPLATATVVGGALGDHRCGCHRAVFLDHVEVRRRAGSRGRRRRAGGRAGQHAGQAGHGRRQRRALPGAANRGDVDRRAPRCSSRPGAEPLVGIAPHRRQRLP